LRERLVTERTRLRYNRAVNMFYSFCKQLGYKFPTEPLEVDERVCECLEEMWHDGESQTTAGNLVAGLQYFAPRLRRTLNGSWQLLRSWSKAEMPTRATPLDALTVQALAAHWLSVKEPRLAVMALVGFHCFLRTAEMANLRAMDVLVSHDRRSAVVSLKCTKSGQRSGMIDEAVTIEDPLIASMLKTLVDMLHPVDTVLGCDTSAFRGKFGRAIQHLGLEHGGFKPYSLRRGGATDAFVRTRSMDYVVVRGRWSSPKTARVYIMEGVSALTKIKLKSERRELFASAGRSLVAVALSNKLIF
jgi:hypothetical protein